MYTAEVLDHESLRGNGFCKAFNVYRAADSLWVLYMNAMGNYKACALYALARQRSPRGPDNSGLSGLYSYLLYTLMDVMSSIGWGEVYFFFLYMLVICKEVYSLQLLCVWRSGLIKLGASNGHFGYSQFAGYTRSLLIAEYEYASYIGIQKRVYSRVVNEPLNRTISSEVVQQQCIHARWVECLGP